MKYQIHPRCANYGKIRETAAAPRHGRKIWKPWTMAKGANIPPARFLCDQVHLCQLGQGREQRHLVLAAQIGSSTDCKRSRREGKVAGDVGSSRSQARVADQ